MYKLNTPQIFVLLVVIGLGACKKEEIKIDRNASSKPQSALLREGGGGDDDDDLIVQGLVMNGSSEPQIGEMVELFKEGELFPIQDTVTDSNGEFLFQVLTGNYFVKVSPQGSDPVLTDILFVEEDITLSPITIE